MYIHIGNEILIKSEELLGIFDIEAATVSKDTRDYLTAAAKRGQDISCTEDLPRSFIVTFNKKQLDERVYISRISPKTIEKRAGKTGGKR